MHAGEQFGGVGARRGDRLGLMGVLLPTGRRVARPPVGDHDRSGINMIQPERSQRGGARIVDDLHATTAQRPSGLLNSDHDQRLAQDAASPASGLRAAEDRLVDLDDRAQPVAARGGPSRCGSDAASPTRSARSRSRARASGRERRSRASGWSSARPPRTTPSTASAFRERSSRPSPRRDDRSRRRIIDRPGASTPAHPRRADTESPPANATSPGSPDTHGHPGTSSASRHRSRGSQSMPWAPLGTLPKATALRWKTHFRNYSLGNQLLIAMARPTATRGAGFRAWLKLGYSVQKRPDDVPEGAWAIKIWAPCPPSRKQLERWQHNGSNPDERPRTFFKLVPVFDRLSRVRSGDVADAPLGLGFQPGSRCCSRAPEYAGGGGHSACAVVAEPAPGGRRR